MLIKFSVPFADGFSGVSGSCKPDGSKFILYITVKHLIVDNLKEAVHASNLRPAATAGLQSLAKKSRLHITAEKRHEPMYVFINTCRPHFLLGCQLSHGGASYSEYHGGYALYIRARCRSCCSFAPLPPDVEQWTLSTTASTPKALLPPTGSTGS